eukprot:GILJ01006000.1.p1 GENE.GILJ01006000.1~~GILJ01006000.1.p1  ORF type:complete len:271 (+),score=26.96 GILJ01006000.1:43-813(+)
MAMKLVDLSVFDWNAAPFNSITLVLASQAMFLSIVYVLQRWIKRRGKPLQIDGLFAAHNLLLSIFSLIIMFGCLHEVFKRITQEKSTEWLFCESQGMQARGSLYFWSYLYYLSKYYELLDTILLVLRGSKLSFLHVYHHVVVLFMAWNWMQYTQTLQFIGVLFNTSVHVVMYYYFFLQTIKRPPRWRRYVTVFQVVQFVVSVLCFIPTVHKLYCGQTCAGTTALYFNALFNVSLLFMFVRLLFSPAKSSKPAQKTQ